MKMRKSFSKNYQRLENFIPRFERTHLVVIGDLMRDKFIWGKVRRISPEAPVPVVEVEKETSMLGGAANVVNNLIALGAKIELAGVAGDDDTGKALIEELSRRGVGVEGVIVEPGRPTTVKTRIIAHSQQMVRVDREVRDPIKPETGAKIVKALSKTIPHADLILISDYAKGVISSKLTREIFPIARRLKKKILVDPKLANWQSYRGAQIITPNHLEAGQIARFEVETDEDAERAGRLILEELKMDAVVITRGERGISLLEKNQKPRHIPTEAKEVYDVTGAGDTVISTLGVCLAAGMSLYDSTVMANLAAGIAVSKLGTSVVSREELLEALRNGGL